MHLLPHVAARLFGTPLMIHQAKLEVLLAVLGPRLGLAELAVPPQRIAAPEPLRSAPTQIAVLPIVGTLVRRTVALEADSGLVSYAAIGQQLEAAVTNPAVTGILLDIDSPGGESGGVFDLADRIHAASQKKPLFAVASEQALSAGYALASGASRLFVSRTSGVGSIGVLAMHVDQSVKDAKEGVRYTTVFAGERKNDLNPHEPISGEAFAFLRSEVDRVYGLFVETVARHRGLTAETVRATEAGLFFGQQAIDAGLADALGTVDDALDALITTVSPHTVRVTAARPVSPQPTMESFMPELAPSPPVEQPIAPTTTSERPPIAVSPPTVATGFTLEDSVEITQLCTLAGRAELIMGFLETRTSPAKVRAQLLTTQAESTPEIVSRLSPDAPAPTMSLQQNPVVMVARARAGKEV